MVETGTRVNGMPASPADTRQDFTNVQEPAETRAQPTRYGKQNKQGMPNKRQVAGGVRYPRVG